MVFMLPTSGFGPEIRARGLRAVGSASRTRPNPGSFHLKRIREIDSMATPTRRPRPSPEDDTHDAPYTIGNTRAATWFPAHSAAVPPGSRSV